MLPLRGADLIRVRPLFYAQDLRYAFRQLARSPAFTCLTVLVLAGGLGLAIFTFAFLYTAILKPLPLPEGDRIVRLERITDGRATGLIDAADLSAIRPDITTLTALGVFADRDLVLDAGDGARSISATATEWNIFQMTRTPPLLGRGFTPDDQAPGAEPVIVLTHATFTALFGRDESVVGQLVRLNGTATRVVGVMPPGYAFPVATDAYVPIRPELLSITQLGLAQLEGYARLAPGADAEDATAELTGLLQRIQRNRPAADAGTVGPVATGMTVRSFPLAQIGDEAPLVVLVLNALAAMILLLACINVTNLLLARANERAREIAVRLALGASRARLIVQTSWESVLLGLTGGALAVGLAVWGLNAVNAWAATALEGNLAFWWVWGYDPFVLVAAGAFVTAAIAVLAGVASRQAARMQIDAVLREGTGRGGGHSEGRVARVLVIAQVIAVSLLMYFGSLSAIVAYRMTNLDFGYDTRDLLSAGLALPEDRYPTPASRGRLFQGIFDSLAQRSELEGAVLRASLADIADRGGALELEGRQAETGVERAHVLAVLGPLTPLGIDLREGRFFDSRDGASGAPTALVSRAMAERYWPGRSPLGAQISLTGIGEPEPRTVVGVVDDVLLGGPLDRARSAVGVYVPLHQSDANAVNVEIRHRGSDRAARAAYQETLTNLDPLLVSEVRSFDEMLATMTVLAASVTRLLGGCFAFALLLAVSGTYGLMARSISRRTRELGVRRALGASDRTIVAMLLGQGGRQVGLGASIALPFALAIGWVFSLLFPVSMGVSLAAALLVSGAITMIVLATAWVPARRAIAIAPHEALRRE